MSDLQLITDDSDLRKYRIELPNIIDDLGLTPYEGRLYVHYKRVCGAGGGTCTEGTRGTARRTKMSAAQVSNTRNGLAEKGLIEKIESGQYIHVKIIDIWELNFAYFLTKDRPDIAGWTIKQLRDFLKSVHTVNTSNQNRSPDEHSVRTVNTSPQKRSPGETKKEPINKNQPIVEESINSSSESEIWQQAQTALELQMTHATFQANFAGVHPLPGDNGTFKLAVPSERVKEVIENRLNETILRALAGIDKSIKEVEVVVL